MPGVHGGPVEERIDAHAEPGAGVELAGHRLAQRHRRERAGELVGLRARDRDVMDLALERRGRGGEAIGHERPADPFRRAARRRAEAEIGQHAAHALDLAVVVLLERVERGGLARLDAVERFLQARQRAGGVAAR